MNDGHFHLLINHFPIIGLLFGTVVLLFGLLFKSSGARMAAYFLILVSAFLAIPSFSSGEGAEEVVEHMSGMSEQTHHLIHEHEEQAEGFMPFAWSLILLSIASMLIEWKKRAWSMYAAILTLLVAGAASYFGHEVGESGGMIAHPEVRSGFKMSEHEEHEESGEEESHNDNK